MDFIEKNKGALGGGILLLLALFLYNLLAGPTPEDTVAPAANVGADLLKVADNISRATLSTELFSVAGYKILSDFSTPLKEEPLGRSNPFAPLGK
jgi:hypothetical protein